MVLGFSTSWWKNKHNLHHAAPNECDQTYKPIDEDIDTLPLLAWSKDILATVDSKIMCRVLQWQHIFFFPMLMFARFTWLLFSWLYCSRPHMPLRTKVLEKGTMLVHYIWFLGIAFWLLHPAMAMIWIFTSELVTGTLLGLVFVLNHNGKEVYNTSKDFVNAQVGKSTSIFIQLNTPYIMSKSHQEYVWSLSTCNFLWNLATSVGQADPCKNCSKPEVM
jgi:hypothetical protein